MSRWERGLTPKGIWITLFVSTVIGALVAALFSWWLMVGCLAVVFCLWAVAVLAKTVDERGDDDADR